MQTTMQKFSILYILKMFKILIKLTVAYFLHLFIDPKNISILVFSITQLQKLSLHFVKQGILIAAVTQLYYNMGEIYRLGKLLLIDPFN